MRATDSRISRETVVSLGLFRLRIVIAFATCLLMRSNSGVANHFSAMISVYEIALIAVQRRHGNRDLEAVVGTVGERLLFVVDNNRSRASRAARFRHGHEANRS
jgi:hypothetical protein